MTRTSRLALVGAVALTLASAAMHPYHGADPNDGFTLVKFDASDDDAKCLDGTQAGYYVRPGRGAGASTYLIELEGGGWCVSPSDCADRAATALGSSKDWPATGSPTMDGGDHGLFSNNCTVNTRWCNATMLHINYCDGASFAGYRPGTVALGGKDLYLRGRAILDAALEYATTREGMGNATHVLLKGCSAGGLATILHLDYVNATLSARIPGVSVVGVPDAGYFLNHHNYEGQPYYTPLYKWVAETQNVTPSVNAACVAAYPAANAWQCFMAQYVAPHLATPAFFAQDLNDSWQLANILQLPCHAYAPGSCNATEVGWVHGYHNDTLAALAPVLAPSSPHGGFFTSCVQHCHSNINFCFDSALVQGQSMQQTLLAWYDLTVHGIAPGAVATVVVDGPLGTNPTCQSACSPY